MMNNSVADEEDMTMDGKKIKTEMPFHDFKIEIKEEPLEFDKCEPDQNSQEEFSEVKPFHAKKEEPEHGSDDFGSQIEVIQGIVINDEFENSELMMESDENEEKDKRDKDKKYKCNECDYGCDRAAHFKRHLMRHTGERPFTCNDCDYKSTTKYGIVRHSKTHTGEKQFKCTGCDYSSSCLSNLQRHMRKHTGEKLEPPEKLSACPKCDYRSAFKKDLTIHIRRHTGEKPYTCSMCKYSSADPSAFRQHLRTKAHNRQAIKLYRPQLSSLSQFRINHS